MVRIAHARTRTGPARRLSAGVVVGIVLAGALGSTQVALLGPRVGSVEAGTTWRFSHSERCFMRKINRCRARHGRRRLERDKQLGVVARRHARRMARSRAVYHDDRIGRKVTRWIRLGQNTGMGGTCRRLFRAFWRSSRHRSNILGRWRYLAVGARRRGRRLYVQQIFEARRNPGNIWHYP